MKKALLLNRKDIKKILAEKFNVPEDKVVPSQYSYTVTLEDDEEGVENENQLETAAAE